MAEREILWVIVNTNSQKEADRIGKAVLKARLAACYNILPSIKAVYYWPPKSNKLETSKGPILTFHTLQKSYKRIQKMVTELHSDKLPLIGAIEIEDVSKEFYGWVKGELD